MSDCLGCGECTHLRQRAATSPCAECQETYRASATSGQRNRLVVEPGRLPRRFGGMAGHPPSRRDGLDAARNSPCALLCGRRLLCARLLLRHAALADPQSGIGRLPAAAGNGHDDECPILTEATAGAPSRPPPAPERIATAPQGETDGLSATSQSEAKPAQRGPNRRSQNARARLRAGSAVIRGWIMPRSRSAASGPGSEATAERLSLFQS